MTKPNIPIVFLLSIIFFWVLIFNSGHVILAGETSPLSETKNKVFKVHELDKQQAEDFERVKAEWFKHSYWPCTKKRNLEANCSSCSRGIIMHGQFHIDGEGRLSKFVANEKSRACLQKMPADLQHCFLQKLKKLTWPKSLYNMVIEDTWGRYLKC